MSEEMLLSNVQRRPNYGVWLLGGCGVAILAVFAVIAFVVISGFNLLSRGIDSYNEGLGIGKLTASQQRDKLAFEKQLDNTIDGRGKTLFQVNPNKAGKPTYSIDIRTDVHRFEDGKPLIDDVVDLARNRLPQDATLTGFSVYLTDESGRKLSVYGLPGPDFDAHLQLAYAAPTTVRSVSISQSRQQVLWQAQQVYECGVFLEDLKKAVVPIADTSGQINLLIQVGPCKTGSPINMAAYHLQTTPSEAGGQLDRLLKLHEKIENSLVLAAGVTRDNTLVLVQKDRKENPRPSPDPYRALWPYGEVLMTTSVTPLFNDKPDIR